MLKLAALKEFSSFNFFSEIVSRCLHFKRKLSINLLLLVKKTNVVFQEMSYAGSRCTNAVPLRFAFLLFKKKRKTSKRHML